MRGERCEQPSGSSKASECFRNPPAHSRSWTSLIYYPPGRGCCERPASGCLWPRILPICSYCKNIRRDDNYWEQVESYVAAHSEARFSHGVCPDCYERVLAPRIEELRRGKNDREVWRRDERRYAVNLRVRRGREGLRGEVSGLRATSRDLGHVAFRVRVTGFGCGITPFSRGSAREKLGRMPHEEAGRA